MPSKTQRMKLREKAAKLDKVPMKEETVRDWKTVATEASFEGADRVRKSLKAKFAKMKLADGDFQPLVKIRKSASGQFLVKVAEGTKKVKHIDYEKVAELA